MEILEAMVEIKNNGEEIEQWTEKHRAAVAIYDAPIEETENRIVIFKRQKKPYDAKQEKRRIQRKLEDERRILDEDEEERRGGIKEKKKEDSLLNDCKFSKIKLPKLVITKFDGTHFDWFRF